VGCVVLWRSLWSTRNPGRELGWAALGLFLVPGAVYLAAYIPFFATGHSVDQFVELQRQILYYHSHLRETHAYQSQWWEWPLALRPVWYYVDYLGDHVANIYANGNPVLSVAFVPAVLAVTVGWWRRREPGVWVLITGFFGQWLPWALVPRIAFAYHFLPATPFGCIAVAVTLGALYRRGAPARAFCFAYVAAVAASFAFFYPIYAAIPLTKGALEWRFLLPSWR
jgi:dolichyl-phosphate-mannose-protein mannosyltransferase